MPFRRTSIDSNQRTGFYSPKRSRVVGSRVVTDFDPNAFAYLSAVEAADGQALEFDVKVAVNNFVIGCKSDGIWTAIKASCILAGARTLSGALVPLVGTAPTNFKFSGEVDSNWANVSLLLQFGGINGSNTFTDFSTNNLTVTANGNAQISTAQSKFDGTSVVFDGSGDYLTISSSAALSFGTGDFTLEAWIRPAAPIGGGSNNDRLIFGSTASSPQSLFFLTNGGNVPAHFDGTTQRSGLTSLQTDVWSHVAWVRSAGTLKIYVNGTEDFSGSMTTNLPQAIYYIGGTPSSSRFMNGYIDEFRATKGVARYTTNFTAPTKAFGGATADYNRETGLVGDGSTKYLDSNRNNNADPQNNKHVSVFATTAATGGTWMNSGPGATTGRTGIVFALSAPNQTTAQTSINSAAPFDSAGNVASAAINNKLAGLSRSNSAAFTARFNGANTTVTLSSTTPNNGSITLYARPASPVDFYSSARFAFYSIGESLDLALLDTRVTTLINAIAAAIP